MKKITFSLEHPDGLEEDMTAEEVSAKEAAEAADTALQNAEKTKADNRTSAINKIKSSASLTDDEVTALFGE